MTDVQPAVAANFERSLEALRGQRRRASAMSVSTFWTKSSR